MWLLIIAGVVSTGVSAFANHTELTTGSVAHKNRTDIKMVKNPMVVNYDLDIDPITHLEMIKHTIEMAKRVRRNPKNKSFDRGYDEFLRNYRQDGDGGGNGGGGTVVHNSYKVKDSEEQSESEETDDDEDDEDDEDEESSDEKKSRSKKIGKKYKSDYDRIAAESGKNKKGSKYCKYESRGNMICQVCNNPKNDEKSESCKLKTDPKDKKFAYSNEKKYSHKENDNSRESFEDGHEYTTKRPTQLYGPRPYNNRYPVHGVKPVQPTYRRVQRPPPNSYSVIRYRLPLPRPQRIRIITLPGPAPVTPLPSAYKRAYPFTLDNRPPRDIGWLQNRQPYSQPLTASLNDSKLQDIELLPDPELRSDPEQLNRNSDGELNGELTGEYVSQDWSECRQYTQGELLCFECNEKQGTTSKECMFATKQKPEEHRQFYAKSNAFDYEEVNREPLRSPSSRRQAKIHPAWQTSYNPRPVVTNYREENKSTFSRDPKQHDNDELKVQHRSYGEKTNSKPKATALLL